MWTDLHIRAFYDSIPVWYNGNFGVSVDNGTHYTKNQTNQPTIRAFTAGNTLTATLTANNQAFTLTTSQAIDFSNYSKVTVVESASNWEINVSGYNGLGYLCIAFARDTIGNSYRYVCVSSTPDYFADHVINNLETQKVSEQQFYTVNISEIVVE